MVHFDRLKPCHLPDDADPEEHTQAPETQEPPATLPAVPVDNLPGTTLDIGQPEAVDLDTVTQQPPTNGTENRAHQPGTSSTPPRYPSSPQQAPDRYGSFIYY